MRVDQLESVLDQAFAGVARVGQLGTASEPRLFVGVPRKVVSHQTRWYGSPVGLVELFYKWPTGEPSRHQQVVQLNVRLLGTVAGPLAAAVDRLRSRAEKGAPDPWGHPRYTLQGTSLNLEEPRVLPGAVLGDEHFRQLRRVAADSTAGWEERAEALDGLGRERSARVVEALLESGASGLLPPLLQLSEWGEQRALPVLEKQLAQLEAARDPLCRLALTAQARLKAWEAARALVPG